MLPASQELASQEPASREPASQEPASREPASREPASQELASSLPLRSHLPASNLRTGGERAETCRQVADAQVVR